MQLLLPLKVEIAPIRGDQGDHPPRQWGTGDEDPMTIRKIIACTALGALIAAPALAQTPMTPEQREARFVAADTNKDNKLDKAEWVAVLPEQAKDMADQIWSSRVDADGDGFITKEQFLALRMGPPGGRQ